MRNISVLMMATMAPAMPPPPGIFETLICGFGVLSFTLHLLTLSYHTNSCLRKFAGKAKQSKDRAGSCSCLRRSRDKRMESGSAESDNTTRLGEPMCYSPELQGCAAENARSFASAIGVGTRAGWRRRFACGVWAGESPAPPWPADRMRWTMLHLEFPADSRG